jgi:hypothetical protein
MATSEYERAWGMHRPISRRDFLNGMAIGAGATIAGFPMAAGALPRGEFQGQTDQNFAVMHALRDKSFWETAGTPEASGEHYDLIVVGAGISGLAAAFLFQQQAGTGSRILILDNSEDFGGHARRNEFTAANGRRIFGYGGSESFQSPGFFSPPSPSLSPTPGSILPNSRHGLTRAGPKTVASARPLSLPTRDLVPMPYCGQKGRQPNGLYVARSMVRQKAI